MPDYNHDGTIDKYDKEMEEIFLEEDGRTMQDLYENTSGRGEGWALIIVFAAITAFLLALKNILGIH